MAEVPLNSPLSSPSVLLPIRFVSKFELVGWL